VFKIDVKKMVPERQRLRRATMNKKLKNEKIEYIRVYLELGQSGKLMEVTDFCVKNSNRKKP
jgi:hypothetical protein